MKRQTDPDVLLLQAAADPTRLAIIRQLSDRRRGLRLRVHRLLRREPADGLAPLKVLRDAGWIDGERRGTWIFYSLRPEAVRRFRELAGGFGPASGSAGRHGACPSSRHAPRSRLVAQATSPGVVVCAGRRHRDLKAAVIALSGSANR